MDYGFAAYSSDDTSIVIASETDNAFYIGKGIFTNTINGPYDKYYLGQFSIAYHRFKLPNTVNPPIIFTTTPASSYVDVGSLYYDGTDWYVMILCRGAGCATIPTVYAFVGSNEYATSSPAPNYGMQLKNAAGVTTFDSRWGKKLLVCSDVRSVTKTNGFSTIYTSSITKPAVAFSAKYVEFSYGSTRHLYAYSMGINLATGSINITKVLSGFQLLLFNGSQFLYYNGFYDPGAGYVPQLTDWSSLFATFNDAKVGSLPIIDGAYYD